MPRSRIMPASRNPDESRDEPTNLLPPDVDEVSALRLLDRTPQPYHRPQTEIHTDSPAPGATFTPPSSAPSVDSAADRILKQWNGTGKQRWRDSRTPSESGSEADDEGNGLVKALPAPPLKPRKGLRDLRGADADRLDGPPITPSVLEEEERKYSQGYFKARGRLSRASSLQSFTGSATDEETRREREIFLRRRRAELVRRACELALLIAIGGLVVRNHAVAPRLSAWHRVELIVHGATWALLLAIYPVRLLFRPQSTPESQPTRSWKKRIRIPAAFDPGPIFYPTSLPVLVSLILLPANEKLLLPNAVLSLSAVPSQLIPGLTRGHGYDVLHWFTSLLPLIASQNTEWPSKISAPKPYMLKIPPPEGLDPDLIASLFALHQAVKLPLQYLTTTSLLPAEVDLLSICLINVYLFSESPQAIILQAVIWYGGISLFASTGKVLKWAVALARTPRWRLRRAGQRVRDAQWFIAALSDGLAQRTGSSLFNMPHDDSSSEEDGDVRGVRRASISNPPWKHLSLQTTGAAIREHLFNFASETKPAADRSPSHASPIKEADGFDLPRSKRRNTLPPPNAPPLRSSPPRRRRARSSSLQGFFLSLTPTQAALRKWLYAFYVYAAIVLIIAVPVHQLISRYALRGHEAISWAVGYLFGDVPPLRSLVQEYDLTTWIPLPDHASQVRDSQTLTLTDVFQNFFGPSNLRLLIIAYFLTILGAGITIVVKLSAIPAVEVDTRRKVFHGMMVLMLLPTTFLDPCFIALALAAVLALFLLLEVLRASQLPPLSKPLSYFLAPYVDGRDLRGPVVVSHIFLAVGCAIPLWLALAGVERIGDAPWEGWEVTQRNVAMVAGVVCVGMGDAAASLIGRRFGRRKWPWAGGKSLEGSAAFAFAVTVGLMATKVYLWVGGWEQLSGSCAPIAQDVWIALGKAGVAACGASFMEAVLTGANDNVVVPVVLWLLVQALDL